MAGPSDRGASLPFSSSLVGRDARWERFRAAGRRTGFTAGAAEDMIAEPAVLTT